MRRMKIYHDKHNKRVCPVEIWSRGKKQSLVHNGETVMLVENTALFKHYAETISHMCNET